MSRRALEFVETWVSDNVSAEDYRPEGDDKHLKELASRCIADALAEGIPADEIREAFDDLPAFIGGEIEEDRDREEGEDDDEEEDEEEEEEDEEEEDDEEDEDGREDK